MIFFLGLILIYGEFSWTFLLTFFQKIRFPEITPGLVIPGLRLYTSGSKNPVANIPSNSIDVQITAARELTITVIARMLDDVIYYINIDEGFVENTDDNCLANSPAINDAYTWRFATRNAPRNDISVELQEDIAAAVTQPLPFARRQTSTQASILSNEIPAVPTTPFTIQEIINDVVELQDTSEQNIVFPLKDNQANPDIISQDFPLPDTTLSTTTFFEDNTREIKFENTDDRFDQNILSTVAAETDIDIFYNAETCRCLDEQNLLDKDITDLQNYKSTIQNYLSEFSVCSHLLSYDQMSDNQELKTIHQRRKYECDVLIERFNEIFGRVNK